MIELRQRYEERWPADLCPAGEGSLEKEPFETWWARHRKRLKHLHAQIAEQWVYRHFSTTPYQFLALEPLSWRLETWTTRSYLDRVHLEFGGPVNPEHDYQAFHRNRGRFGPARGWSNGTWDVPPVVIETPAGVRSYDGDLPDVRFLVIEGSRRHRYLFALAHRGEPTGPHVVFIITSPEAGAT